MQNKRLLNFIKHACSLELFQKCIFNYVTNWQIAFLVQQCFLLADLNVYKCGADVGTFLLSQLIGEKIWEVNFHFKMQIRLYWFPHWIAICNHIKFILCSFMLFWTIFSDANLFPVCESTFSNIVSILTLIIKYLGFNFFRPSERLSCMSRSENEVRLKVNYAIHAIQNEKLTNVIFSLLNAIEKNEGAVSPPISIAVNF